MSPVVKRELVDLDDDLINLDYGIIDKDEYDPRRFKARIRVTQLEQSSSGH